MILILEDDPDRIRRFHTAIKEIALDLRLAAWRDAHRMVREVEVLLPRARLISLDHDLEPEPDDPPDLGAGLIGAKVLASHGQPCPVIIHRSNKT